MHVNSQPTEREVRQLRDKVYGHSISDKEWEHCKLNWLRPDQVQWLKEKVRDGR